MTSLAFILGVLPLASRTGAGAGARHSIGTGVLGGMIAATFLAIFFVPLFFKVITERSLRGEKRSTEELPGRSITRTMSPVTARIRRLITSSPIGATDAR